MDYAIVWLNIAAIQVSTEMNWHTYEPVQLTQKRKILSFILSP